MLIKRVTSFVAALTLSVSSLFVFAPMLAHAVVQTCVWTGAGSDAKFSTTANWSSCGSGAPLAGDALSFPALGTKQAPLNDTVLTYSGVAFSGASGSCSASPYAWYVITGTQPLSLSGNISNSMTGSCASADLDLDINVTQNLSVTGTASICFGNTVSGKTITLSAAKTLTITSTGYSSIFSNIAGPADSSVIVNTVNGASIGGTNTSFLGTFVLNAGSVYAGVGSLGASSAGTTVNAGADLSINILKNTSLSEPITLTGASSNATYASKLNFSVSGDSADYAEGATTLLSATYNGALTLGSDAIIGVSGSRNKMTVSGALAGSFKITRINGENGVLTLAASPNGSQTANGDIASARKDTAISADQRYVT